MTTRTYHETMTESDECNEDRHADCLYDSNMGDCTCHDWEIEE
jgi:hypothetical protein